MNLELNYSTLIEEVQKRPGLYTRCSNSKIDRHELWQEIIQILCPDYSSWNTLKKYQGVQYIRKKWKNMRTQFVRNHKARKMTKNGCEPPTKYMHYDAMQFLLPSIDEGCGDEECDDDLDEASDNDKEDTYVAMPFTLNVPQLIDEVKKRPALYSRLPQHNSSGAARKVIWEEVAEILNPVEWKNLNQERRMHIVDHVRKRWRNLRTSFARYVKDRQEAKMFGKSIYKYVYYDAMKFLLQSLETWAESDDDVQWVDDDDNIIYENDSDVKPSISVFIDESITDPFEGPSQPSKVPKLHNDIQEATTRVDTVKNLMNKYEEMDDSMHFMMSTLPMLRKLNDENRTEAKIRILTALKEICAKQNEEDNS